MDRDKATYAFSAFDIFAYLGNGFMLILGTYLLYEAHRPFVVRSEIGNADLFNNGWVLAPTALFLSYAAGHAIAHLSYPLYDRLLVRRFFGMPADHALGTPEARLKSRPMTALRKTLLILLAVPEYERRIPASILEHELELSTGDGACATATEHYSLRAHFTVVNEYMPKSSARLATFLEIYSFSRNASLTLLLLAGFALSFGGSSELPLGVALLFGAWVMLGRYLRFLKTYTDEIYVAYNAYQSENGRPRDNDGKSKAPRVRGRRGDAVG